MVTRAVQRLGLIPWRLLPRATVAQRSLSTTTLDHEQETGIFYSAEDWWDDQGGVAFSLHSMNTLRVPLITRTLLRPEDITTPYDKPRPLEGYKILDVGCGGGILSEPLARLGAEVTGIEPMEDNLAIARDHAHRDPEIRGRVRYERASVNEFAAERREEFDVVVASEVVEHVNGLRQFIKSHCALVKPGGHAVFTTINRTLASYVVIIALAEKFTGLFPQGTHQWDRFVTPRELGSLLEGCGMEAGLCRGMYFSLPTNRWHWTQDDSVNYALTATKPHRT